MMGDPEMKAMAEEEYKLGKDRLEQLAADLQICCCRDPDDGRSVFLEIRAGTGGRRKRLVCGRLAAHVQPLCGKPRLAR